MATTTLGKKAMSKDTKKAAAGVGGGHGGQQVISKQATAGSAAAGSAAGSGKQLVDKTKFKAILARGIKSGAIKPVQIGLPLYNYDPRTKKTVWGGKRK
ncbi:hypothetical protein diail_9560, partial [Diaporthe ilicicola]